MTPAAPVKDGVNPNAPTSAPSLSEQIKQAEENLAKHRTTLNAAKRKHEGNMQRARELRELLVKSEKALSDNTYDTALAEESRLMAIANGLKNQATGKVVSSQDTK